MGTGLRRVSAAIVLSFLTFSPSLAAGPAVPVPAGFRMMCVSHPAECRGGGASSVAMTDELMGLLERVNAQVNRSIKADANDPDDKWVLGASRGDCEEFVLAKRRALIRKGIPASALSIVYATRKGGGHAILAIHTDAGSFVLDNLRSTIKPLSSTGYRLVSMSGPDPKVWRRA